jgi:hypothetical protein
MQCVGSAGLLVLPEPTLLTKVAAGAGFDRCFDNVLSGLGQASTGVDLKTSTRVVIDKTLEITVDDPHMRAELAPVVEGTVDQGVGILQVGAAIGQTVPYLQAKAEAAVADALGVNKPVHLGPSGTVTGEVSISQKNLQKGFMKHGEDFGFSGDWNPSKGADFAQAIRQHVDGGTVPGSPFGVFTNRLRKLTAGTPFSTDHTCVPGFSSLVHRMGNLAPETTAASRTFGELEGH